MDSGLLTLVALLAPVAAFLVLAIVAPLRRAGRPGAYFSILGAAVSLGARPSRRGAAYDGAIDPHGLGLAAERGPSARHDRCACRRDVHSDARARRAGRLPGAGVLAVVPERRAAAGPGPLLHVSVALRVLDDGARARAQSPAVVHLLGTGRALLLSAHWLLVSEARSRSRRGEGVLDHQSWRRRPADRHRHAVDARRERSTLASCA